MCAQAKQTMRHLASGLFRHYVLFNGIIKASEENVGIRLIIINNSSYIINNCGKAMIPI